MEVTRFSMPKEGVAKCSKIKTMPTVCFDWEGAVHHGYAPPGQTVIKEYYLNGLHQLREAIQQD